jgi:hypothetical protein
MGPPSVASGEPAEDDSLSEQMAGARVGNVPSQAIAFKRNPKAETDQDPLAFQFNMSPP